MVDPIGSSTTSLYSRSAAELASPATATFRPTRSRDTTSQTANRYHSPATTKPDPPAGGRAKTGLASTELLPPHPDAGNCALLQMMGTALSVEDTRKRILAPQSTSEADHVALLGSKRQNPTSVFLAQRGQDGLNAARRQCRTLMNRFEKSQASSRKMRNLVMAFSERISPSPSSRSSI